MDEGDTLLVGRPWRVTRAKLDEEPNHESSEENQTRRATQLRDELSETVELELKWCVLSVAAQSYKGI